MFITKHYNIFTHFIVTPNGSSHQSPVATGNWRTSKCGCTHAAATNLHTGGPSHVVVSALDRSSKPLLHRWAENCSAVINRPADMSNAVVLDSLPQANTELGRPPSEEEVKEIKQFSDGKAPDADSIPGEVYKHGGGDLLQRITKFQAQVR